MCRLPCLGDVIHANGAYLHFEPQLVVILNGSMKRLITRGFRLGNPIAEALRHGVIKIGDGGIHAPTAFLLILQGTIDDDTSRHQIVHFLERHILSPHLGINRRNRLQPPFDRITELVLPVFLGAFTLGIDALRNAGYKILRRLLAGFLRRGNLGLNLVENLRILVQHQLLFQLGFQLIQAQTVDNGDINVLDFVVILPQPIRVDIVRVSDIIHTVHDFQQHRPHVVNQRKEHHLESVGVVGDFLSVQTRNLAEILKDDGHRLAELLFQLLDAHILLVVNAM